jgi:hypothetical protein
MAHDMAHSKMAEFLEDHPRMMGSLFTMALLLMEAGNVAANAGSTTQGP